jgi:formate hydrogenlyase subunit 4
MKFPDSRGWLVIALCLMTTGIFIEMAVVPALLKEDLFKMLATAIVSTGLLTVVTFYFGSSKGSSDKDATVASAVSKMPDAPQ